MACHHGSMHYLIVVKVLPLFEELRPDAAANDEAITTYATPACIAEHLFEREKKERRRRYVSVSMWIISVSVIM